MKRNPVMYALAALALLGAACGTETAAGSGGGSPTLTIEQPADGARVQAPFEVRFSSGEELGSPETGNHHVHLFFDGNKEDYEVVNAETFLVSEVPGGGDHTIGASLHHADHSPAGAEDAVEVTIAGAGGSDDTEPADEEGGDDGGQGGYDY